MFELLKDGTTLENSRHGRVRLSTRMDTVRVAFAGSAFVLTSKKPAPREVSGPSRRKQADGAHRRQQGKQYE